MLDVVSVTKTFGDTVALKDVSFKADKGQFLFVTGPSGSGKTTLLRLIMREFLPDSGEILFDDKDITKLKSKNIPDLRQKIGVVFQDFKLMPERKVRENIEVALAVIGLGKNDWQGRVEHVLDLVDLKEKGNLFPSQLSGGELQRVSLARALVVNPKLILADEPTGNLDWETADELMRLFKIICEEGKTIIMATHHKLIIDKYASDVINLKRSAENIKETESEELGEENASDSDTEKSEVVNSKEKGNSKKAAKKKIKVEVKETQ